MTARHSVADVLDKPVMRLQSGIGSHELQCSTVPVEKAGHDSLVGYCTSHSTAYSCCDLYGFWHFFTDHTRMTYCKCRFCLSWVSLPFAAVDPVSQKALPLSFPWSNTRPRQMRPLLYTCPYTRPAELGISNYHSARVVGFGPASQSCSCDQKRR
jgi:hypothetical protein